MPNAAKKAPKSIPIRVAQIGLIAAIATAVIGAAALLINSALNRQNPPAQSDKVFVVRVIDIQTNRKLELADVSLSIGDVPYNKHTGSDGAASFSIPQDKIGQSAYLRVEKVGYKPFGQQLGVNLEEMVIPLEPLP